MQESGWAVVHRKKEKEGIIIVKKEMDGGINKRGFCFAGLDHKMLLISDSHKQLLLLAI